MSRIKLFFQFIFFVMLLFLQTETNATEHYTKQWSVATVIGSFANNPRYKYYLEPQIRFIDDRYVFNQFLFLGGLGYQLNPDMMIFAGPGWIISKNPNGSMFHEERLWEQFMWNVVNTNEWSLNSRTRLEERKNTAEPQIAIRLRERLWLRIPFEKWPGHSFSAFDELFFNLNHPQWTSNHFFEQNRAFMGIGTQLSKSSVLDIGYLNQMLFGTSSHQVNNVFLLSLIVLS